MELRWYGEGNLAKLQYKEYPDDDWDGLPVWKDVPKAKPEWCEHIKQIERGKSSSIQGQYWGYHKCSGAYPQNICEEWTACPICGAKRPT